MSKYTSMSFSPSGITDDEELRLATSILDYIFRRLAIDFLPYEEHAAMGIYSVSERLALSASTPSAVGVDAGFR